MGSILGSPYLGKLPYSGGILGTYWGYIGVLLGIYWGYIGIIGLILGVCKDLVKDVFCPCKLSAEISEDASDRVVETQVNCNSCFLDG